MVVTIGLVIRYNTVTLIVHHAIECLVTFKDLIFKSCRVNPSGSYREQHRKEGIRKGACCFNYIIGPPQKDGHDMPLLPYQRTLYEALQNSTPYPVIANVRFKVF